MYIIKTKRAVLDDILKKYFQKDVNDLPYEAFEELEEESYSKLFTSCINILSGIEEKLPYANDTYVFLNKEHYDLMLDHCGKRMEFLKQYNDNDFSGKKLEYMECKRLFDWLQKLDPNWSVDVVLYEHDC